MPGQGETTRTPERSHNHKGFRAPTEFNDERDNLGPEADSTLERRARVSATMRPPAARPGAQLHGKAGSAPACTRRVNAWRRVMRRQRSGARTSDRYRPEMLLCPQGVPRPRMVRGALYTPGGRREAGMSPLTAPRRSPTSRGGRADQQRGTLHAAADDSRAPTPAHHPRSDSPYLPRRGDDAVTATPLAAVEASAEAAVEAAAGLVLSAAALAADTLAAVLSPTEFAAEVITRAAHSYRGTDREGSTEAGPYPDLRPSGRESGARRPRR